MDCINILQFFRIQTQSRAVNEDCQLDESSNLCNLLNFKLSINLRPRSSKLNIEFLLNKCAASGRAAKDDPHCRWPNGIVPYQFYKGPIQKMVYDPNEVKIINKVKL